MSPSSALMAQAADTPSGEPPMPMRMSTPVPSIAAITTGGFVVELVFAIPGLGRYFVQAVQQLDYTVIMGTTVFYGSFLVFMVIVVDLLYGLIDPRVRLE